AEHDAEPDAEDEGGTVACGQPLQAWPHLGPDAVEQPDVGELVEDPRQRRVVEVDAVRADQPPQGQQQDRHPQLEQNLAYQAHRRFPRSDGCHHRTRRCATTSSQLSATPNSPAVKTKTNMRLLSLTVSA